jgi:hypothetical protein
MNQNRNRCIRFKVLPIYRLDRSRPVPSDDRPGRHAAVTADHVIFAMQVHGWVAMGGADQHAAADRGPRRVGR